MSEQGLHHRRLLGLPLPRPHADGDKEDRGRVLVVGGGREVPGGVILAGTAALRVGAGKLQIATSAGIAVALGVALPEARVFALPETEDGGISPAGAEEVVRRAEAAEAVLLGPGMVEPAAAIALTSAVVRAVRAPAVVLDAGTLPWLHDEPRGLHHLEGRAVITPHAGEMARILGIEREAVLADPSAVATRAARELRVVVALKGARTYVASPEGTLLRYSHGRVGLATSGSGDTLSGLVAGLLARGADPLSAAAWAVYLHGEAGNILTRRLGPLGFLGRELADEVPGILSREER